MFKLYNYFRSSASYRARIALGLKGIDYEYVPVHLIQDGGQQHTPAYRAVNPAGNVPTLEHDGFRVAETMAILQYLDDVRPTPRLFPADARARAVVVQICELINSGIQPLGNLKVTKYMSKTMGLPKEIVDGWTRHWIVEGFAALETLLKSHAGRYAVGDEVTAADLFLVAQCFTARRFGVRMEDYPLIARVDAAACELEAFRAAHPEKQPDWFA